MVTSGESSNNNSSRVQDHYKTGNIVNSNRALSSTCLASSSVTTTSTATSSTPTFERPGMFFQLPQEVRNLFAGGIAGMFAKSFVAPIDRIKILYQVSSRKFSLMDVPNVAVRIISEEGVTALWKGNVATMIRVFPYSGIQFMVFDACKTFFLSRQTPDIESTHQQQQQGKWKGLSPVESLLSGSMAGSVSVLATYPLDLTRAQLAVMKRKKYERNVGFAGMIAKNYNEKGISALFRGITPTMLGILPYAGIAFTVNEQAKRRIHHITGRDPTTMEKMQCGAGAGLVAQTITYPLEVTRRRMQTMTIVLQQKEAASSVVGIQQGCSSASSREVSSMFWTMKQLYQEQGMRGFFKGVSINWLKGPVAFSISFTTYDLVQEFLMTPDEVRERRERH